MAAAADKRARRKEGSSSIRPEFGNHTCDICNKDCHSHIGLFSHNQFAYMFVFVKQNILTNRKDRRRLPNREVLSRSSIRRKWSCPRPVPMVAPGGHFLCNSASKKNEGHIHRICPVSSSSSASVQGSVLLLHYRTKNSSGRIS